MHWQSHRTKLRYAQHRQVFLVKPNTGLLQTIIFFWTLFFHSQISYTRKKRREEKHNRCTRISGTTEPYSESIISSGNSRKELIESAVLIKNFSLKRIKIVRDLWNGSCDEESLQLLSCFLSMYVYCFLLFVVEKATQQTNNKSITKKMLMHQYCVHDFAKYCNVLMVL